MENISKFLIAALIAVFALGVSGAVLAQDSAAADTTGQTTAQDLEISEQRLLPDSPFYFLKEWRRGIQSFFAFGRLKKTELEQRFANERLIELKKLTEEGKASSEVLEKATEKYNRTMEKIKERAEKIKENAEQNEGVNKFLEKFTNQQILHERILQKLEEKVPEDVLEKIKEARERHLERFQEVMQKLESNKERIAEKIENALKDADETDIEILDRIRNKMPENLREEMGQVRERVIEKVVEGMYAKNQEINRQNPSLLCPTLALPEPDFCLGGKIIPVENEQGCLTRFACEIEERACTLEYAPVCGKDGKTYSNKCTAESAGVEVDYGEKCRTEKSRAEECIDQGGVWKKWGLALSESCNLKTTDYGKLCTDKSQCEGQCIGENQESISGKCSEWKQTYGCRAFIQNGKVVGGILCID